MKLSACAGSVRDTAPPAQRSWLCRRHFPPPSSSSSSSFVASLPLGRERGTNAPLLTRLRVAAAAATAAAAAPRDLAGRGRDVEQQQPAKMSGCDCAFVFVRFRHQSHRSLRMSMEPLLGAPPRRGEPAAKRLRGVVVFAVALAAVVAFAGLTRRIQTTTNNEDEHELHDDDDEGRGEGEVQWRATELTGDGCWALELVSSPQNVSFPRRVRASVPGHAALDVARNLSINPYESDAEKQLAWVALATWAYSFECPLPAPTATPTPSPIQAAQLRFETVDTVADVFVNGVRVGSTSNAYRSYAFPLPLALLLTPEQPPRVRARVRVRVVIQSSLAYARSQPHANEYPHTRNYNVWAEPSHRNMVRKPGADFGWDWGPAFPGAGIPGRVWVETSSVPLLPVLQEVTVNSHVILNPDWDETNGERAQGIVDLRVHPHFRFLDGGASDPSLVTFPRLEVRASLVDPTTRTHVAASSATCSTIKECAQLVVVMEVERPWLWWPANLATRFPQDWALSDPHPQPGRTYRLDVSVFFGPNNGGNNDTDAKKPTHFLRRNVGFRSFRLWQWESDPSSAKGYRSAFRMQINTLDVNVWGSNWVPPDAFHARASKEKMKWLLASAVAAGHSLVRVWGGGPIPPRFFFDLADEMGLMVWQDLPYACAVYPASPAHVVEADEETRDVVRSLQTHPCIVVWGGNNEVEASFAWFPRVRFDVSERYKRDYVSLFVETIGKAVSEVDFARRPYIDSSPSNGLVGPDQPVTAKAWGDVTDPTRGDVHFYSYDTDCAAEGTYPNALFVSEHGFPSVSTELGSWGEFAHLVRERLRHAHGMEQMEKAAKRWLGPSFTGFVWDRHHERAFASALVSQLVQARCMSAAVRTWRFNGVTSGVVLWQLNDAWPGVSWSLVEWSGAWKPAMHAVSKAFSRVVVSSRFVRRAGGMGVELAMAGALPTEVRVFVMFHAWVGRGRGGEWDEVDVVHTPVLSGAWWVRAPAWCVSMGNCGARVRVMDKDKQALRVVFEDDVPAAVPEVLANKAFVEAFRGLRVVRVDSHTFNVSSVAEAVGAPWVWVYSSSSRSPSSRVAGGNSTAAEEARDVATRRFEPNAFHLAPQEVRTVRLVSLGGGAEVESVEAVSVVSLARSPNQ